MGLDQYLGVKIIVEKPTVNMIQASEMKKELQKRLTNHQLEISISLDGDPKADNELPSIYDIDGKQLSSYVLFDIDDAHDYFRKSNQIQRYFEDRYYNSDQPCAEEYDCIITKVDDMTLADIVDRIDNVMAHQGDKTVAQKKFPTTTGFFYGDDAYDDYYYHKSDQFRADLVSYQKVRNEILKDLPYEAVITYRSWW